MLSVSGVEKVLIHPGSELDLPLELFGRPGTCATGCFSRGPGGHLAGGSANCVMYEWMAPGNGRTGEAQKR